jgi:hypothetical protein
MNPAKSVSNTYLSGQVLDRQIAFYGARGDKYALAEIMAALGLNPDMASFAFLAADLSRIIDHKPAWTKKYLHSVYKGHMAASAELRRAISALGAMIDGTPAMVAETESVTVHARPDMVKPGSLVMGRSRICSYPPCGISFVPEWPMTRCCCAEHQRLNRNLVQRMRRKRLREDEE